VLTQRQTQRRRLLRLAAQQRGYFTAAQAVEIGYSYQAQKHHVDYGNWLRVGRGLFRLPEWPTDEHDHLVRWTLWSGGVAVVSHLSALSVHDLGDVDPARVHLSVPAGFRRSAPGLVLHQPMPPEQQVEDRGGYRVTTPTRAIAECAQAHIEQQWLDVAVGDALARGLSTPRRLRDAAAELGEAAEAGVDRALKAARR
jgi:predicted transcriptional regulator of viral defense system